MKQGGILHVVLSHLESLARSIIGRLKRMTSLGDINVHPRAVERMIDQRVVRIPRNRSQQGFMDIRQYEAATSGMYGGKVLFLDTEPDGSVYKPDSLSMEALRPW